MTQTVKKPQSISATGFRISRKGTRTVHKGNQTPEIALAVFDPSANTAQRPIGAYGLGVHIPEKAVVTRVLIDVVTTFASAGADAGTIAVSLQSANDVVSAIAISDASNVWDAGIRGSKIGFPNFGADAAHDSAVEVAALFASSMLKLTAEREVTVTVGGQALTAGKAIIAVEYFLSE